MSKNLIVDISHHQPSSKINWAKATKEVALMIIRVQYGSATIDREYKKHAANCKRHGIPFGHYIYSLFKDKDDAVREAKNFLSRCDKDAKFLVVDVEEQTTKTKAEMAPATQVFIDYLKANDSRPIGLYTGHHTYKPFKLDKVKADFLWIPRYGKNSGQAEVKPDYACELWQYTEKGRVDWYGGFVDLNKINGSKTLEWFIGNEGKPPAPVPSEPMWKGLLFKKGQIGLITILKPIILWIDVAGKLTEARTLNVGDQCRVYGYREKYGGQYDVGGGHWITNIDGYIKYETPSKVLLEKAKEYYK